MNANSEICEAESSTILIVEDDPTFVLVLKTILLLLDPELTIECVDNYEQAAICIRKHSSSKSFSIISDFNLKTSSTGADVWATRCEVCPQAPFLLISTIQNSEILSEFKPFPEAVNYLPKPSNLTVLQDECRKLMGSSLSRDLLEYASFK
ncbi:MAG: hypothetical protein H7222_02660 [Methylotenera sp.]|nr:hypothetical protein [Oligoflexia bacterium]